MTEAQLIARISEIDKTAKAGVKRGAIVRKFKDLAAEAVLGGLSVERVIEVFKETSARAEEQLKAGTADAATPYKL